VLDASVVVAAVVDGGAHGRWAEGLVVERDLIAPEIVGVEATNILRRLEAAGAIDTSAASLAFQDVMSLEVVLCPFAPFAERAWELRRILTLYDAWYVAVAEALDLPLATLDQRLARAPSVKCGFLTPPGSATSPDSST